MIKKQTKNRIIFSSLLLAIIAAQLGGLFFSAPIAQAQQAPYVIKSITPVGLDVPKEDPVSGNCAMQKMAIGGKVETSIVYNAAGSPAGLEDEIKLYIEMYPVARRSTPTTEDLANLEILKAHCTRQATAGELDFRMNIFNVGFWTDEYQQTFVFKPTPEKGKIAGNITFKLSKMNTASSVRVRENDNLRFTFEGLFKGAYPAKLPLTPSMNFTIKSGTTDNNNTITTGFETEPSKVGNKDMAQLDKIRILSTMRNKYRVLYNETGDFEKLHFGKNGLDSIKMNWKDRESSLTQDQPMEIPDYMDWRGITWTPYFYELESGFNYKDKVPPKGKGCEGTYTTSDCSAGVFVKSSFGDLSTVKANGLPAGSGFDPSIYEAAWQARKPADVTADEKTDKGDKLYSIRMAHLPIVWGSQAFTNPRERDVAILMNQDYSEFDLEVFNTLADIKAACEKDGLGKDICDDPLKMRYSVGKEITVETGTTSNPAPTAAQTLYGFITRVISDLIIWLQSVIFRVFAYVVVPILNALLHVRPYQDKFVNVIYPGWLILRNLANIFFIVSLLVVGLRILFQQSAAGAARSFIMRLVIMALLVNFSLVIGQGIIGIADTVQSQFLPADTRVIEALGQKLMVEPLKNFREEITHADNGEFNSANSEAALSDTVKPIVLLVLSIAAFFSFVAVAAFLTVRLVALWVLYMLSPIAYVGFVMDETKKYASQWWTEFIKYAILTPVLVFFLNIAALMATVLSNGGDKELFKLNQDGSLSGDVVIGSLTILTHFIVLFFLFAGMKFAASSGTFGSQAIVDYAKKGFDTLTTRPAKWAGRTAKGMANDQYERRIKGGLFDPMAYKQAWKDSIADKNKKKMSDRLARSEGRLTPGALINNKIRSMKYLATGARFGSNSLLSEKQALLEEAAIMTNEERKNKKDGLDDTIADRDKTKNDLDLLNDDKMSLEQANEVVADLDAEVTRYADLKQKLEDDSAELRKKGRDKEADKKDMEALDAEVNMNDAESRKNFLEGRIAATPRASTDGIMLDDPLKAQIEMVFDPEASKEELGKSLEKLEKESKELELQLKTDDKFRDKYGYGAAGGKEMKEDRQEALRKEAEAIEDRINNRELPISMAQRDARLTRQREQEKLIEDLDGEELEEAFEEALRENNQDLAIAISKKIAKEGNFDDLLQNSKDKNGKGYNNNVEDFQRFINDKFGKMAPKVRVQVGSEISSLAEKNGNMAISKSTTIRNKNLSWRGQDSHDDKVSKALEGKRPDDLVKMKKYELSRQTASGSHVMYKGAVENFNKMNGDKLKEMRKKMSSKLASHIMSADNFGSLKKAQQDTIRSAALGI